MTRRARLGIGSACTLDSVTKRPQRVHYEENNQSFVFIDTPGIDVEDLSPDHLNLSRERLVDGIIYLYPINRTRLTVPLRMYEKLFKILAGEDWERKMLFATTMWHEVDNKGGEATQLLLEKHWKQATDKGAKVDRFSGETCDAWRLIKQVLPSQVSAALMKTVGAKSGNIVIAIMGPTGAGKSTFISHAYGKSKKSLVSHHIKPHTAKVQPIEVMIDGCRITLLDTPGFDDSVTDTGVLVMIADWLQETYSNQVKLTGIIYMHRISDNRMTESTPFKKSKTFAQICGTREADRLVLVTTMWGCVPSDVGGRREESLKNDHWKGLIDRNAQVARFDATFESARNIIRSVYEPLARGQANLQQANHDQSTLARRDLPPSGSDDIQSIPDEDDFQTSDSNQTGDKSHTILPTSHQGGEQNELNVATHVGDEDGEQGASIVPKSEYVSYTNKGLDVVEEVLDTSDVPEKAFYPLRDKRPKDVGISANKIGKIFEVTTKDLREEDIVIAVMGPTGTGKSSFINMAAGNAPGLKSCVDNVEPLKLQCICKSPQDIIFVDIPGFDDICKSETEILQMIAVWVKQMYEQNVKLAGILYFHRITDSKKAGVMKNLQIFQKLCGSEALRNTILTTTMWDEADRTFGEREERNLVQGCWKSMMSQGAKTMRYWNTEESAWDIIDHVLSRRQRQCTLDLQKELVAEGKGLLKTGAGEHVFGELQALVKWQRDSLHQLRASMGQHDDEVILNALKEEYDELRRQKEAAMKDIEALKLHRGKRLLHLLAFR
ncbi:hypothetical protein PTI98_013336 [Pleurotus ostreatus]|nr:hypothetical protein PTI98_013336 [Pleurotus ostreatus]